MAGEFQNIDNALKIVYPPKAIEAMVNEETPFRKWLKKQIPAGGRVTEGIVKFGANLAPPQNVGQTADGGALVTPKDRTDRQFTLRPSIFTAGFQIGWMTRAAATSNKSAFNGGELRRRTEETITDLAKFIEQTYVATSGSGRRAIVESDPGANQLVLAQPLNVRLLRVNHVISLRTTDGGDSVRDSLDNRTITAINESTRTITYSGVDQTPVIGDHVHIVTAASQTGLNSVSSATMGVSANGLRGLVDDGTHAAYLHGLQRAATGNQKLSANVSSNAGVLRSITEQILINACHSNRHASGKRVTDMWTNTGQAEKYIEFVAPDRRYNVSGGGVQGMGTGYQEDSLVHYAPGVKAKIQIALDLAPREMYLLNMDGFFHYLAQDMDWWDAPMLKPTPATTTYSASYLAHVGSIENIGLDFPVGNTVIRDLKDPLCGDT